MSQSVTNFNLYRRVVWMLFGVSLFFIIACVCFAKLGMDASMRSNIGLYGEKYVPRGMSSYNYSVQQSTLADRYALCFAVAETIVVAALSAGSTLMIISRHERKNRIIRS